MVSMLALNNGIEYVSAINMNNSVCKISIVQTSLLPSVEAQNDS